MVQHPLALMGVSSPGWMEVSERVPGLKELYHFNSQSNNALFYCHMSMRNTPKHSMTRKEYEVQKFV